MLTQNQCPAEVLSQSLSERLQYFKDKVVAHPRLAECYETLARAIAHPAGASLIFVFGPTGVGKTTLRRRTEQYLIEQGLVAPVQHPGRLPVVGIEAVAPGSGNFNWKDYYKRTLIAMDEPFVEEKIRYSVQGLRYDHQGRLFIQDSAAASELRRALEQALHHRHPAAVIVDEAQHFKKMASGRRLLDQMDTIKSLAEMTGIVHVLIGTYELLDLANLSAQLSRRSLDIHFPRYRADLAEDINAFKRVLLTLQHHLPLKQQPDLISRYDYFYERSAGCVGVLKDWLTKALATALAHQQETLADEHLERHALSSRKLLRLAREIKEGEDTLTEMAKQRLELRALLGMNMDSPRMNGTDTANPPRVTRPLPAPRRGQVGQRKADRDPIGGPANG